MEIFLQTYWAGISKLWLAFIPFIIIIVYLLGTGHASIGPNGKAKTSCCGDNRVKRGITVFGGASAFTFGLHWGLIANLIGLDTWLGSYFAAYAILQFGLSCLQTVTYLFQLARFRKAHIRIEPLKAHLEGCGYTTGWSPLWPLFWMSKMSGLSGLMIVRDAVTIIDWIVSAPCIGLLNILFLPIGKKVVKPGISHVDDKD